MTEGPLDAGRKLLEGLARRFAAAQRGGTVDDLLEVLRVCHDVGSLEGEVGAPVVAALRSADVSWLEISAALGLTRQAVWERYRYAEGALDPALVVVAAPRSPEGGDHDRAVLEPGRVYTRVELRRLFDIKDATLNNGVFFMRSRNEIWLFVTRDKQPDRTQFVDELLGDELRWEGQTSGRTDALVANHAQEGNQIVLFYRQSKNEHPGGGFSCEGRFEVVDKDLTVRPSRFVLKRAV